MRVVFLQDVPNVAEAGEVREVKRGYAKNYLLPRSLAVPATARELNRIEAVKRGAAQRRQREETEVEALGRRLEGVVVTLLQRAGPTGRLYGSVTNAAIAEELSQQLGRPVDRRAIEIGEPIRQTGEYEVTVRLGPEQAFPIKVVVTTEELLRQREAAREGAVEAPETGVTEELGEMEGVEVFGEVEEQEEASAVDELQVEQQAAESPGSEEQAQE